MFFEGIEYYQIPNFEGYFISKFGKVLSTKLKIGKILKPKFDKDGYEQYSLRKNKKANFKRGHRLVAMTFLEDYSEDLQVDHEDNNKANNNLSNLRMATQSINQRNILSAVGFYREFDKRDKVYYYHPYWTDDKGINRGTRFSVNKYGEVFAYLLAYNLREEMVAKYYNRP